jgi:hypothetical protein
MTIKYETSDYSEVFLWAISAEDFPFALSSQKSSAETTLSVAIFFWPTFSVAKKRFSLQSLVQSFDNQIEI